MKLLCYRATDSLYIDLKAVPSTDSIEVADGVVIDIDHASQRLDLDTLDAVDLPATP